MTFGEYLNVGLGDFVEIKNSFSVHNGMQFSTMDAENDIDGGRFCSQKFGNAGWWYRSCSTANLNGLYGFGKPGDTGITWDSVTFNKDGSGKQSNLNYTRMLIRRN